MITEDYVSFETAKLLKEKGFKGECLGVYFPDGRFDTFDTAFDYNLYDGNLSHAINGPTLQMAMKWLREIYKLSIELYYDIVLFWVVDIKHIGKYTNSKEFEEVRSKSYDSYEQACEAAIKYCLENLI